MAERDDAIALANRVLDRLDMDPDCDLCTLSRQFLREMERTEHYRTNLERVQAHLAETASRATKEEIATVTALKSFEMSAEAIPNSYPEPLEPLSTRPRPITMGRSISGGY